MPIRVLLAAGLLLSLSCSMHTKAIRRDFADYNQTIHYNNSQQMLLNLVRLKYRETPLFMEVGALSASYDVSANAELSGGRLGSTSTGSAGVGGRFAARPTITYTPLLGEMYAKRVLAEIDPDTFVLLVHSGWPIRALCHVMTERIGGAVNNEDDPTYDRFVELVEVLDAAQDDDKLRFLLEQGAGSEMIMEVTTKRGDLLGGSETAEERTYVLPLEEFLFRSLLDLMFFLGKNTEVPDDHLDQVRSGRTNGWISIRNHASPPDDALVSVPYNGRHFSIAKNDVKSKDTFALLKLLFALQAGDVATVQPVLTLPVAQP